MLLAAYLRFFLIEFLIDNIFEVLRYMFAAISTGQSIRTFPIGLKHETVRSNVFGFALHESFDVVGEFAFLAKTALFFLEYGGT